MQFGDSHYLQIGGQKRVGPFKPEEWGVSRLQALIIYETQREQSFLSKDDSAFNISASSLF